MQRRIRYLVLALLLIGACGAVTQMPFTGPHRKGEAAIAIRDFVPGYQQFFTERYTVPRLAAAYEQSWYFTESDTVKRKKELVDALTEATAKYEHVDLYLLAHGNRYIDQVRQLPPEARRRIRLVYDTGGGSATRGPEWLELGVESFVGHPGGNIAPVFYVHFLPQWLHDQKLEPAVKSANEATHDMLDGPLGRMANRWVDTDRLWAGTEAQMFVR